MQTGADRKELQEVKTLAESIRIDRMGEAVREVESSIGYCFRPEDIKETIQHTLRKCELNGKDEEYFYYLLQNELKDLLTRTCINAGVF